MAGTAQDLIFQLQHQHALADLLQLAREKCKELCSILNLPYSSGGAGTRMEVLYMTVIEKIIEKGVPKRQLVATLKSERVGHGNLAQEFEDNEKIKDNKDGKIINDYKWGGWLCSPPIYCTL